MKHFFIAYRKKTGCKQYCFDSYTEMRDYFDKKWYSGEIIKYIHFHDDIEHIRSDFLATHK
jgi:hypothetical protein